MAEAPATRRSAVVERYSRGARWFHAGTYLAVLLLLGTGWWLLLGREGAPSIASGITGVSDITLHTYTGWALTALAALGVVAGARAVGTFVRESVRVDRGDLRWFLRWPLALITGRFPRHDGHFDPGQRIMNLVIVALLATLVGSGVGLTQVVGGPGFVWLDKVHRWSTYLITPVLIGHIAVASGILPGYWGVARSMHLGGRLRVEVARRIWPGWLDRHLASQDGDKSGRRAPSHAARGRSHAAGGKSTDVPR